MVAFPARIHLHIVYFCNTACLLPPPHALARAAVAYCQWRRGGVAACCRWQPGGGVSFLAKVSFIANCAATTTHNVNPQIAKPKIYTEFPVDHISNLKDTTQLNFMINFLFYQLNRVLSLQNFWC